MRCLLGIVIVSAVLPTVAVAQSPRVRVRVENVAGAPEAVVHSAEAECSRIFGNAGIKIVWAPEGSTQSGDLNVVIAARPFQEASAVALGYVIESPAGESAYVVWSRVIPWIAYRRPAFEILGRVMAHEIGHLLLGDGRHSDAGLMRGTWSGRDLQWMASGSFSLTAEEQTKIRRQVTRRAAEYTESPPAEAASLRSAGTVADRYGFLARCCR